MSASSRRRAWPKSAQVMASNRVDFPAPFGPEMHARSKPGEVQFCRLAVGKETRDLQSQGDHAADYTVRGRFDLQNTADARPTGTFKMPSQAL